MFSDVKGEELRSNYEWATLILSDQVSWSVSEAFTRIRKWV